MLQRLERIHQNRNNGNLFANRVVFRCRRSFREPGRIDLWAHIEFISEKAAVGEGKKMAGKDSGENIQFERQSSAWPESKKPAFELASMSFNYS